MSVKQAEFTTEIKEVADSYNETPYESEPFFFTKPSYLKSVGLLFGVDAPPLENARILEIGCAGGMNLVQFASEYPNSYTLGIDISSAHINQANQLIQELQLSNIEFQNISISDLDKSIGHFDYIICHGVFSWVPPEIRTSILQKTKELLSKNGVAFISYNTLPGWNMISTVRDMQLFHSEIFSDYKDKLIQGKLFLKFITESLVNVNNPYINFLKEEASQLDNKNESYIRHEYFEQHNTAFYFKDFIKLAQEHNLAYLSEAMVSNMYLGNMPVNMQKQLSTIKDIVRLEQYLDFIVNKRFRTTIICHAGTEINRKITTELLDKFFFAFRLQAKKNQGHINFEDNAEVIHYYNYNSNPEQNTSVMSTTHPTSKVILSVFEENIGNPLSKAQIIELAYKKFSKIDKENYEKEFNTSIPVLIFGGHIQYFCIKPNSKSIVSKKPKVSELNIYRAKQAMLKNKPWFNLTTQVNEAMTFPLHQAPIISNLNGTNTIEQLKEIFINSIKTGEVKAMQNEQLITDEETIKNLAHNTVNNLLNLFSKFYILVG